MMVVQDEDGEHDAARHHEHYAVEVSSWLVTGVPTTESSRRRLVMEVAHAKNMRLVRLN